MAAVGVPASRPPDLQQNFVLSSTKTNVIVPCAVSCWRVIRSTQSC